MGSEDAETEEYANFDFAIMAIFATYLFEVSSQIGETRVMMEKSRFWGQTTERLKEGMKGVRRASLQAISLCLLLIIATAIGLSLPTRALDQRMIWILEGMSLLFAAVVFGILSFDVGRWTGLYYKVWEAPEEATMRTIEEVQFKVRWSYYRIFARYFFFLMPFYQGANALTIPVSMIAGIGFGLVISFGVYCARRRKVWFDRAVIFIIALIVVFSSLMCGDGTYFVALVWGTIENPKQEVWSLSSFVICICVESLLHATRWYFTRKKGVDPREGVNSAHRPRMAASLIIEARKKTDHTKQSSSTQMESVNESEGPQKDCIKQTEADENDCAGADLEAEPEANGKAVDTAETFLESESHATKGELAVDPGDPLEAESVEFASSESSNVSEADDYIAPTYKQMLCSYWTCCGCLRGDETRSEKAWFFLHWFIWWILACLSLYVVAINLGSTAQQENARAKLPYVRSVLYDNINAGPVCAFDNKGADSNITTFEDKEAAHAEGFLVLHCGECGSCSDWHNLRQEYVTRNSLAADSAKCGKKSLLGGREAVLECLKEPPIDFQGQCAACWADDIICTKGFCAVIYMQSLMINSVSNFQVQEGMITSASCEEANCEAGNPGDFVNCSGATRRRMNITSSIARPGAQRCGIVDVDWAELFPE